MAEQREGPDLAQKAKAVDRHKTIITNNADNPIIQAASKHASRVLGRDMKPVEPFEKVEEERPEEALERLMYKNRNKMYSPIKELSKEESMNKKFPQEKTYHHIINPETELIDKPKKPPLD